MAIAVQQIDPIAHLPLVLGVLRRLEVATMIDRLIPPHPAHATGRGVEALAFAILDGHYKPRQNIVYLSAELNRLCRIRVSTDISICGSHLLAGSFCLYTAWLLVEMLYPGYSRFNSAPA